MPIHPMAAGPGESAPPYRSPPALLQGRPPAMPQDVRPGDPAGLTADVMDLLSDAVILTDRTSRVIYANRSARELVSRRLIAIRGGVLCAGLPADTQKLQALTAACLRGEEDAAHMRTAARLFVTIVPLQGAARVEGGRQVAVVLLRDLEGALCPSSRSVIAWFGLTPAEARLAQEIVRGDGLVRCARRLGTRITTVRSHLKHIFEKTETRRQAHLVRLLLSCGSPVAVPRRPDRERDRRPPPDGR